MAAKKKRGGPRLGAGRPPGKGPGPSPDARVHRVTDLLSTDELRALRAFANEQGIPVGTAAHGILARALRKR